MKLIDRDLLLSEIEKSREKNPHNDSKIRANHTIEHDHIAHLVLKQPTAYDVDKAEIQLKSVSIPEDKVLYASPDEFGVFVKLKDAVEIIKSGGIE